MLRTFVYKITCQVYETLYNLNSDIYYEPNVRVSINNTVLVFITSSTKDTKDAYVKGACQQRDSLVTPRHKAHELLYRNKKLESELKDDLRNKIYKLDNKYYTTCSNVIVERIPDGPFDFYYQVKVPIKMIKYSSYLDILPNELRHIIFIKSKLSIDLEISIMFNIVAKQLYILAFPDLYKHLIAHDMINMVEGLVLRWETLYNDTIISGGIPQLTKSGDTIFIYSLQI